MIIIKAKKIIELLFFYRMTRQISSLYFLQVGQVKNYLAGERYRKYAWILLFRPVHVTVHFFVIPSRFCCFDNLLALKQNEAQGPFTSSFVEKIELNKVRYLIFFRIVVILRYNKSFTSSVSAKFRLGLVKLLSYLTTTIFCENGKYHILFSLIFSIRLDVNSSLESFCSKTNRLTKQPNS